MLPNPVEAPKSPRRPRCPARAPRHRRADSRFRRSLVRAEGGRRRARGDDARRARRPAARRGRAGCRQAPRAFTRPRPGRPRPLPRPAAAPDSVRALRAADAVVLSSKWENFPHVLVEALAVGTPVVSTDTGGVAEIVRDGENGLLVQTGDPDAGRGESRGTSLTPTFQRLREAAPGSVECSRRTGSTRGRAAAPRRSFVKTRLLMVGRRRYRLPPATS